MYLFRWKRPGDFEKNLRFTADRESSCTWNLFLRAQDKKTADKLDASQLATPFAITHEYVHDIGISP